MLEQESTGAYMHTLKISILDASDIPDGWDFRQFRESLARRKLQSVPMRDARTMWRLASYLPELSESFALPVSPQAVDL